MIKRYAILIVATALNFAIVTGCSSSVKKADIPSTANPEQEIAKFDSDLREAIGKNIDVLARSEFKSALKMRDEAKSDLAQHEKQEQILDDVRTGRGHLTAAYTLSENRESKAPGLFEARQAALKAGAGNRAELNNELKNLDSDVSSEADDLSNVSTDKLTKMQQQYVDLERHAVVLTQLGDAQAMLNGAKEDGAMKVAPITYKKSQMSLKNAESVISTNVRNPEGYRKSVADAKSDAALLSEVLATIQQNKNLSEPAALKMVSQNRQIKDLNSDLNASASASAATEAAMQQKNDQLSTELATKDHDLTNAEASVEMQRVLEKARSQFTSDEAEAYQQGGSLLIRMKHMNFASGRSDLPAASLASLAKVSEVAKYLNATQIRVEGHTDSVGGEIQNKSISEQRASAVASYFKSNGFENIDVKSAGFGFQKPIATNKSKEGRAQNRRVDIVITPVKAGSTTL